MIIKIKNEESCWSYFEGDNIMQHYYKDRNPLHNEETLYLMDTEKQTKEFISLCIQKDNKVVARVNTNRCTYLMNDNGKTIDKLM